MATREVTRGGSWSYTWWHVGTCGYMGSVTGCGMGSDSGKSDMMVTLEVTVGDTGSETGGDTGWQRKWHEGGTGSYTASDMKVTLEVTHRWCKSDSRWQGNWHGNKGSDTAWHRGDTGSDIKVTLDTLSRGTYKIPYLMAHTRPPSPNLTLWAPNKFWR